MPTGAEPIRMRSTTSAAIAAARQYRHGELDHRVAAATPHELVSMLYEALRTALVTAERATGTRDATARMRQVTRALAILDGLDTSLDHRRGGAVARALAAAYAQLRALIVAGNSEARCDLFAAAADQVADLAAGWSMIATVRRSAA